MNWTKRNKYIAAIVFVLLSVGAGLGIYYGFFHYENAETSESTQELFLPELKKYAVISGIAEGVNASILFLERESTTDFSKSYFVNVTFTAMDITDNDQQQLPSRRFLRKDLKETIRRRNQDDSTYDMKALDMFVSENEIPVSINYEELEERVATGAVEKFHLSNGAIGSHQFQTESNDLTGIAFAHASEQKLTSFACFNNEACAGEDSRPSESPTGQPTPAPSGSPTSIPSVSPTPAPSGSPTNNPSVSPTPAPSSSPTTIPSVSPTSVPTVSPTISLAPDHTNHPSNAPTVSLMPSESTRPSMTPTQYPTFSPTARPSHHPSPQPSATPTTRPSVTPTQYPTFSPTARPSPHPSPQTSATPTAALTMGIPAPATFAFSQPKSSDYPTSGTINFVRRYTFDINTGSVKPFVTMQFVDIDPPNAPGAKIYLSPVAGGKKINAAGVIPVDIEQAEKKGWYTVEGSFEQNVPVDFDENSSYQQVIIWCEPFDVYIGGGTIEYLE